MDEKYSVINEAEPSEILQIPDLVIGNVDYLLRGFLETPGRPAQPSYNNLVALQIIWRVLLSKLNVHL